MKSWGFYNAKAKRFGVEVACSKKENVRLREIENIRL